MDGWSRTLVPASTMTPSCGTFVLKFYAAAQRVRIIETMLDHASVLDDQDTNMVKMTRKRFRDELGFSGVILMVHVIKFLEFKFGMEEDDAFETYTSNLWRDSDALMVGALP